MLAQDFRLPDRPIKINSDTISRSAGTLFSAVIIGALLAFLAVWQMPSLIRDWHIRNNPVVLVDGDVQNGNCSTSKGFFVDCEAHLSYDFQGQHYESDVRQFFLDFHTGDYSVDLVIAADKPELATISIALDKYWNRVGLLAAFLLGFAALILGALVTSLRVARARRRLRQPGRLSLVEVEVEGSGRVYARKQFSYKEPNTKRNPWTTLFASGQEPLILWDGAGNEHGYAVRHEHVDIPVLLDKGLTRLDLTADERTPLIAAIAAAQAGFPQPPVPGVLRRAFKRTLSIFGRILLVIALLIVGAVGYWLYYVLAGTNSHDQMGMDMNNMMPAPVNKWACGKLQLRFGDQNAPFGCTASD